MRASLHAQPRSGARDARAMEPLLTIADVAAALRIARRTVYTIPFLRETVIYVRPRCPRWRRGDIEFYLSDHQGVSAKSDRGAA
jgi:hypothetical protein